MTTKAHLYVVCLWTPLKNLLQKVDHCLLAMIWLLCCATTMTVDVQKTDHDNPGLLNHISRHGFYLMQGQIEFNVWIVPMMVSAVAVSGMASTLGHKVECPASLLQDGVRWVAGCCPEPMVSFTHLDPVLESVWPWSTALLECFPALLQLLWQQALFNDMVMIGDWCLSNWIENWKERTLSLRILVVGPVGTTPDKLGVSCMCATPGAKSHIAAPTFSTCKFCKTCSFLNLPRCKIRAHVLEKIYLDSLSAGRLCRKTKGVQSCIQHKLLRSGVISPICTTLCSVY